MFNYCVLDNAPKYTTQHKTVTCPECQKKHTVPEAGFPTCGLANWLQETEKQTDELRFSRLTKGNVEHEKQQSINLYLLSIIIPSKFLSYQQ